MNDARHAPSTLIGEAASLFHLLGGMAPRHLVIVGGLVPPLLAPDSSGEHLGSADIDLSLSVAITESATGEYYRSIETIIGPYFEATPLDDGTLRLEDEKAAANAGGRLRPFPLRAASLVDADAEESRIEGVNLVYRPGARANVTIRHAGPVGFLASKADALEARDDPKDGYDVSWWCLNARPTAEEVAGLVFQKPSFGDPYFQESVAKLGEAFGAPDYIGPDGYAREANPGLGAGDEIFDLDRNAAFQAVGAVVRLLRERLWD